VPTSKPVSISSCHDAALPNTDVDAVDDFAEAVGEL